MAMTGASITSRDCRFWRSRARESLVQRPARAGLALGLPQADAVRVEHAHGALQGRDPLLEAPLGRLRALVIGAATLDAPGHLGFKLLARHRHGHVEAGQSRMGRPLDRGGLGFGAPGRRRGDLQREGGELTTSALEPRKGRSSREAL